MKIERASNRNGYGWGGGRKEVEKNNPETGRGKRWIRRAIIKSNNKQRSLGTEWSMSKVGTQPPHNSDKPHVLVASTNNTKNNKNQAKDKGNMFNLLSNFSNLNSQLRNNNYTRPKISKILIKV